MRKNFARVSGREKVMKIHKGLCSRNYCEIHRCRCDTASAFQLSAVSLITFKFHDVSACSFFFCRWSDIESFHANVSFCPFSQWHFTFLFYFFPWKPSINKFCDGFNVCMYTACVCVCVCVCVLQAIAWLEPFIPDLLKLPAPIPGVSHIASLMHGTQLCEESPNCCVRGMDYITLYEKWQCPKVLINVTVT